MFFPCLLDLSAAFDTIDHHLMLKRLSNISVEGTPLKWFSLYLQDRHQSVGTSDSQPKCLPDLESLKDPSLRRFFLLNILCQLERW